MTMSMPARAPVHATVRFTAAKSAAGSILLIEDDAHLARSLTRVMNAAGYSVVHVGSGAAAVDKVMTRSFDAVLSDLNLPGASGVDILNVVRAYDPDVPLILMTGCPTVDTAIEACSLGVLEYLVKPTPREQLLNVLARATKVRRTAVHQREVTRARSEASPTADTVRPPARPQAVQAMPAISLRALAETLPDLAAVVAPPPASAPISEVSAIAAVTALRQSFDRALATLGVELEPVAGAKGKKLIGYAARMYSTEEKLTTEAALVAAAEELGRLQDLRVIVRDLAVKAFASAPQEALLFIDVHPTELLDGDLYSPEPALARIADRVVLQVRARGLAMGDLSARASILRFVGFRLAIADLDVGQACLTQLAELSPEFVKIDARLIRGIDGSSNRLRLVGALVSMCKSLESVTIAEGVSTAEECTVLASAGCDMIQGALVMRYSLARA